MTLTPRFPMKIMITFLLLSFSFSAHAAYLEQVRTLSPEARQVLLYVELQATQGTATEINLKAVSKTRWQPGSVAVDVSGAQLNLNGNQATLTIYDVDGNGMGMSKVVLSMTCATDAMGAMCSSPVKGDTQNKLYLHLDK